MTITNGYATRDEIIYRLNSKGLSFDVNDNDVIDALVNTASRHIDTQTARRFYSTTADETRYYTATDKGSVFVDDLLSVTTLKTDTDADRVYETTWLATDYDLCPDNALLNGEPYTYILETPLGVQTFPRQRKGIQIVGRFGFCTTTPDDIKQACIDIVVNLYQSRRGAGVQGVAQITGAGVVITPKDISPFAAMVIASRRRWWA